MQMLDPVHDRLARFAHALTRNRDEARDLVCETLLAAYEHYEELNTPSAFASWLFTIARRIYRHQYRRGKLFGEYNERHAESIHDNGTAPDVAADVRLLHEALARLPESQREAVIMFEISGLTLEEIQQVQGGSLSGVKSRVARGRQKLAELLGVEESRVAHAKKNGVHHNSVPEIQTTTVIRSEKRYNV